MAGVDVGASGGHKRATNSDINMIPFIDLLMVTIAFLLITAVWVTSSRIDTNAEVPGQAGCGEQCDAPPVGKKALGCRKPNAARSAAGKNFSGSPLHRSSGQPRTQALSTASS